MSFHFIRRICTAIVVLFFAVGFSIPAQADRGNLNGPFPCISDPGGSTVEISNGVTFWVGTFTCTTYSNSGKGLFHGTAWKCIGTADIKDGFAGGGGYCRVTDRDGDVAQVRWDVGDPGGFTTGWTTVGKLLSGTGKYSGISGSYKAKWHLVPNTSAYIGEIINSSYSTP